jgi:hypothetical protein
VLGARASLTRLLRSCPELVLLLLLSSHRWSAKHGSYPAGDPALQHYVGSLLYKGRKSAHTLTIVLTNSPLEGNFVGAESHLLASGTRDSARLLAQVYFDWAKAANALESHTGIFALRGILPYAIRSHMYCETLLWIDIYSTAMFSLHVPSLRALSLTSPHLEKPFLSAPPVTSSYSPRTRC